VPPDLLLSSGFLAFARHCGVLRAVEEAGSPVDAVVGTSSGALVGALWSAGMPTSEIEAALLGTRPFDLMGWHLRPWTGLFSMDPLLAWLRARLPPRFDDLPRPFAVGVAGPDPRLLTEGDLPVAVATSCAIPWIFASPMPGLVDGGVRDRLMYGPWSSWRPGREAIAHLVDRSSGVDTGALPTRVIRTGRSGASFWSLGDVRRQVAEAHAAARSVMLP
jgi:predicted acylesterase/phospholipase RssA